MVRISAILSFVLISINAIAQQSVALSRDKEIAASKEAVSVRGSRHVNSHLTSEQCNSFVIFAMQVGLDKMENKPGLQESLEVLAADCGLGKDPVALSGQTVLYIIEETRFAIYNDGQKVSFGETALAAKEFGFVEQSQLKIITKEDIQSVAAAPIPKQGFIAKIANRLQEIYKNGNNVAYFSGLAYHDRGTYTKEKLAKLNEKAWGFGLGKERINEAGNYESLSVMAFADSHKDPSFSLAYFWQSLFRLGRNTSVGAGFTAGLTSRSDILNYVPVPYAFPAFSLMIGKFSMMSVYIPKLNGGINHGAVTFVFAKVPLDSIEFTNLRKQ